MFKSWISAVCVAALGIALPPVVSAQRSAPEPASVRRPYRGIFGGPSDPAAPQSLVFSASLYGAYDDNILAGLSERQVGSPWLQRSGTYWGSYGAIDYTLSKPGDRFSFGARSGAQLQYRQAVGSYVTPYYNGDLHMNVRLTRSTTLGARQSVSYAPNYTAIFSPVAGEDFGHDATVMADPDLELFPLQTLRTATSVTVSQRFGRNTTLSGGYHFRTVDIEENDVREGQTSRLRDYRAHSGSLMFMHSKPLTSNATLVLGYGVRVLDRSGVTGEPRVMHNVNAGVDYSRALSFSRRTSLSFGTGSAIVVTENLQVPDAKPLTRFHLLGNAGLVHEMGRTWTAQLSYTRGLVSRDGFGELYFTDAVTATVAGLVSRRLSLSGTGIWSVSTLDRPGQNRYDRTSASAQATYALTRYLGLYTRYVYYHYEYGNDIPLDPRFARGLDRQGVRVGLTSSVPLMR